MGLLSRAEEGTQGEATRDQPCFPAPIPCRPQQQAHRPPDGMMMTTRPGRSAAMAVAALLLVGLAHQASASMQDMAPEAARSAAEVRKPPGRDGGEGPG